MHSLHAGHTPARQALAKPAIHQLREHKSEGPPVPSLLKLTPKPRPSAPEHWLVRPGLAARVRASLYPLAAGWREQQSESMRLYLRRASQARSPGLEALFNEQRKRWQAPPVDVLHSLVEPYRRLLANHGLAWSGAINGSMSASTSTCAARPLDAQTLERLLGFFTEEQHAVERLAQDLARTELAATTRGWTQALDDMLAFVKAEYVQRVSESPGRPSPTASGASLVAGGRLEVTRVGPADHTQSLR